MLSAWAKMCDCWPLFRRCEEVGDSWTLVLVLASQIRFNAASVRCFLLSSGCSRNSCLSFPFRPLTRDSWDPEQWAVLLRHQTPCVAAHLCRRKLDRNNDVWPSRSTSFITAASTRHLTCDTKLWNGSTQSKWNSMLQLANVGLQIH